MSLAVDVLNIASLCSLSYLKRGAAHLLDPDLILGSNIPDIAWFNAD